MPTGAATEATHRAGPSGGNESRSTRSDSGRGRSLPTRAFRPPAHLRIRTHSLTPRLRSDRRRDQIACSMLRCRRTDARKFLGRSNARRRRALRPDESQHERSGRAETASGCHVPDLLADCSWPETADRARRLWHIVFDKSLLSRLFVLCRLQHFADAQARTSGRRELLQGLQVFRDERLCRHHQEHPVTEPFQIHF